MTTVSSDVSTCVVRHAHIDSHFFAIVSVFFFKQKTAYDMRSSDWSSDVCSSDLLRRCVDGFLDAHSRKARGDGCAELRQQFFRLIFVNIHLGCLSLKI